MDTHMYMRECHMNIEVEIGTSTNKDSKDSKSANKDSKGHQVT